MNKASTQGVSWFQDIRFGMFIHWGLYSILATEEWAMHVHDISVGEYEKLVPQFNPTKFNADEWVNRRRRWAEIHGGHQPPSRWLQHV